MGTVTENRNRLFVLEMLPTVAIVVRNTIFKTFHETIALIPKFLIYE